MTTVPHEGAQFQSKLIQGAEDANVTRYASAVGLVLLLYDHALTFSDSVDFMKNAPPSPAKTVFLLNRALVPASHICVAIFMNHFTNGALSDVSCQVILALTFVAGIFSMASSNVLVMLRVVSLWEHDHYIVRALAIGFFVSFFATMGFATEIMYRTLPGIKYVPYVHSCVPMIKAPALPGVWASSFVFEAVVLTLVVYNALSRPRGTSTPLRRILLRDGILFFAALASLRFANLMISIFARPTLALSGVFFIWAVTTLVLNRSLLNIHKATSEAAHVRLSSRASKNDTHIQDGEEEYQLPDLMEATRHRRHSNR